jgi:Rap1a immunity proteins
MSRRGLFLSVALFSTALVVLYPAVGKGQDQSGASVDRTGLQLQEECQLAATNSSNTQPLTSEEIVKATHCDGYLLGVMDTYGTWEGQWKLLANLPRDASYYMLRPNACIPDGVTVEEAIQVVLKFLQDNPTLLHKPEGYVTAFALSKAYPCMP